MRENTRILTLMFHRVNDASIGFDPAKFERYLNYLVKHFPIVLPGEALPDKTAVCLTFDDAYYDFYHNVFPLLKKHQVKALLAVPVGYIVDDTDVDAKTRLSVPYIKGMEDPSFASKTPFCTFKELKEMAQSGLVDIASHGYMHQNLARKDADFSQEIIESKKVLQEKLGVRVNNFVYPYGRMSKQVHRLVCQHYAFGLRIGGALNRGWDFSKQFVYRINADPLWTQQKPINTMLLNKLTLKYWVNRIRSK